MVDAHLGRYAGENRRLIKLILVRAPDDDIGPLLPGVLQLAVDELALTAADQRSDHRLGIARIANLDGGGLGPALFGECIKQRLLGPLPSFPERPGEPYRVGH